MFLRRTDSGDGSCSGCKSSSGDRYVSTEHSGAWCEPCIKTLIYNHMNSGGGHEIEKEKAAEAAMCGEHDASS